MTNFNFKSILLALFLVLGVSTQVWGRTIYFVNTNDWTNPTCHNWGKTGTTWPGAKMTNTDETYEGMQVWSVVLANENNTGCIFSNNGKDQTGDLTIPDDKNCYNNGSWITYSPIQKYYVTGEAFSGWGSWTEMTRVSATDYTINLPADKSFKVSTKEDYDNAWYSSLSWDESAKVGVNQSSPSDGYGFTNKKITLASGYTTPVVFHLNPSTKKIWAVATAVVKHNASYITPENGTITLNNAATSPIQVTEGGTYRVTVRPNDGYEVSSIKMNGIEKKGEFGEISGVYSKEFSMGAADEEWTATMSKLQYTITYGVKGNGTIEGTQPSGSRLEQGTEVTLTATPNAGYYLRGWYSDAECNTRLAYARHVDNYQYVVTLNEDKTVYAKFEALPSTITLDGNICGRSWNNRLNPTTSSDGVYTWTWNDVANTSREFCFKEDADNTVLLKPSDESLTYAGTGCTLGNSGSPNNNFTLSYDGSKNLTITVTYGSGIYVTAAVGTVAPKRFVKGTFNSWNRTQMTNTDATTYEYSTGDKSWSGTTEFVINWGSGDSDEKWWYDSEGISVRNDLGTVDIYGVQGQGKKNFAVELNGKGSLTIHLVETSETTAEVWAEYTPVKITKISIKQNWGGSWTEKEMTDENHDGVYELQATILNGSGDYYQLWINGFCETNDKANTIPGANECTNGEEVTWVYSQATGLYIERAADQGTVYFKNTVGWNDVYVYFYKGAYWDIAESECSTSKGSGASTEGGSNFIACHQMSKVGDSDVYAYTFKEELTDEVNNYIVFANANQSGYANFDNIEVVYRADFAPSKNAMYVPDKDGAVYEYNKHKDGYGNCTIWAAYYQGGAWRESAYVEVKKNHGSGTEYRSNLAYVEGDIVSFWADADCSLNFCIGGAKHAITNTISSAGVYTAVVNADVTGIKNIEAYTGHYYIRTDAAEGGWNKYKEKNMMYYTDINLAYNYYYCIYVKTADSSVECAVANEYNGNLSNHYKADTYTTASGCLPGKTANVRFAWDTRTNTISRAYLKGASEDDFLTIEGVQIYEPGGAQITGKKKFADTENWVYQCDVDAAYVLSTGVGATITVRAVFDGKTQDFIVDKPIFTASKDMKVFITVLYDFKTNHLIAAWRPTGDIDEDLNMSTDIMLVRRGQGAATQLNFKNAKITGSEKTIYGVMQFEKSDLTNHSATDYATGLYWISFPFDVNLCDVIGLGSYGTYWLIRYYDGAGRAEKGYWVDSPSYWHNVTKAERNTFVMKANVGYVLAIDAEGVYEDLYLHGSTTQYLFFPSKTKITDLETSLQQVEVEVPAHTCTIERDKRYIYDSNWNVIGVPSYANVNEFMMQAECKYLYQWNTSNNNYDIVDGEKVNYLSMHGYMVQFAGTINWQNKTFSPLSAPRYASAMAEKEDYKLRVELQHDGEKVDQTYVALCENATADFDVNLDVCKLMNSTSNIYSLNDGVELAANTLPKADVVVPLGVQVKTSGEYTITLPDGTDGLRVSLLDNETQEETNLLLGDYMINLPAGTYNDRFSLIIRVGEVATDFGTQIMGENGTKVRKVIVGGQLYLIRDGQVFDAFGHSVR